METRLVDVTDVPINLFDDVVNIPFNEIQGIDVFANSLLFSGDWWVPSATNIWGTDPGDLGHYMGLFDMALPFAPQISGLDQPEIDTIADANGTAGLAQQIGLLAAAELPTSASCDAQTCAPMTPPEVITGNTGFDRDIGFFEAFAGNAENSTGGHFDLFSNWLQVPLSDLTNGFTFTPGDDPGLEDPSPDVGATGDVPGSLGFDGTTGVDGTGTGDFMPWAGDTFKLNLFGPFENFYNSLFTAPTGGIDGSGVEIPTGTEILDAFQNITAGSIVAFDPFVAGSPACPGVCDLPADESQLGLLQNVLAWDPTNTSLADYVNNFALQNNATQPEINDAIALLQTGSYNFSPTELAQVDQALANINPELPALYTNEGILTDPNYLAYLTSTDPQADGLVNSSGQLIGEYGGYNYTLVGDDLVKVFQESFSGHTDPTLATDLNTLATDFLFPGDPANLAAILAGDPVAAAAGSTDPTGLTADLSTLLGSFGASAGSDTLSQLLTDLSTQFASDFGTQFAADLATLIPSMF
ncbi:MAG TPA: hypothetical protein VN856_14015 [Mycobacterium sp.]|uniref:hypothetical protein n=1 Tax=Mycobacterium sp. TaxID=1785 RepID=UPI002C067D8C|nr:hypothetical protein [Mycobacterium sp.]HXO80994.1 hypothetical protein [Mycobacterium sp.]